MALIQMIYNRNHPYTSRVQNSIGVIEFTIKAVVNNRSWSVTMIYTNYYSFVGNRLEEIYAQVNSSEDDNIKYQDNGMK